MGYLGPVRSERTLALYPSSAWGAPVLSHPAALWMRPASPLSQVPMAEELGSHDLRRGHAMDLQKAKHPLVTICAMGQWKQGAGSVLHYLDQCELEQDIALETAIHSDDEEWIE